MLKDVAKRLLPHSIQKILRDYRGKRRERKFRSHELTRIKCGDYELSIPSNHLLLEWSATQPYRDRCVGIAAKYMIDKYPHGSVIDIGANIGDTTAIIATYARPQRTIAIEASDYYYPILSANVSKLPGEVICHNVMVADGQSNMGYLHHWGGTAIFTPREDGASIPSVPLRDLVDSNTVFVKIDTDGFDFRICLGSMDWLAQAHPLLLLEDQIPAEADRQSADALFAGLKDIGYARFIVWDDQGFMLLATSSLEILNDLHRYLLKMAHHKGHRTIHNYDVLCVHERDTDVFVKIREYYLTN